MSLELNNLHAAVKFVFTPLRKQNVDDNEELEIYFISAKYANESLR